MAKTKTLMERLESIDTIGSALDAQVSDGMTSVPELKEIVDYQYTMMVEGGSYRWEDAPSKDKAKMRRLYNDVVSGKFD